MSFIATNQVTPTQIKPQSFESRRNSFLLPGVDVSHVYVRALVLGCFQTPNTGLRQPSFLWRKVPESDARSVGSTVILVPEPFGGRWPRRWTTARRERVPRFSGVTKSGRVWRTTCRKAVLGVWATHTLTKSFSFFSLNSHLSFNTNSSGEWKFQILLNQKHKSQACHKQTKDGVRRHKGSKSQYS